MRFIEFLGEWVTESVCPKMDSIIIEIPGSRLNAGLNMVNLIIPFVSTFLGISGIVYGMYQTSRLRRIQNENKESTLKKENSFVPPKSTFDILKSLRSFKNKEVKPEELFEMESITGKAGSTASGMETISLNTSESESSCCCSDEDGKCECLK